MKLHWIWISRLLSHSFFYQVSALHHTLSVLKRSAGAARRDKDLHLVAELGSWK